LSSGFLITARLKSTRLKNKIMLPCVGKPIISHMIERIKNTNYFKKIIICTSKNKDDDPLVDIANKHKIEIFRGSENDVVKRLYKAAVMFKIDNIINIPADNPLVDMHYAKLILNKLENSNYDFIRAYDLPIGIFSYGIRQNTLKKINEIKKEMNTEIWYHYLTKTGLFNILDIKIKKSHIKKNYRFTLDYKEDFIFIETIFKNLYQSNNNFSYTDILIFLEKNPDLFKINYHYLLESLKRYKEQSFERNNLIKSSHGANLFLDYDEWILNETNN
jgi:spore coat polysaccharide biosynthesis protein SpsF